MKYQYFIAAVVVMSTSLPASLCDISYYEKDSFRHLHPVKSFTSNEDQTAAVRALAQRIIGARSSDFQLDVDIPFPSSGQDMAIVTEPTKGKIKISGTSGVAVAFALNHYLKYYCRKQMSWAGDNLSGLPSPLPSLPPGGFQVDAGVKYRYYQNVCTVSYSSVWWNWTRWEREVDWMAFNGINLPLAFTGQEAIWRRVYKALGCTDDDLDNFFAGPAFLAWGRMGNINKWGGPLPKSWTDKQLDLQHRILPRMRSLGMIPVLPGFAGHIPEAITKLYKVNSTRLGAWSNFNCTYSCTYLLEPQDPFFLKIGKMFIEEQQKEYNGTNHIYNADTFNEMTPRSNDPAYLSLTSHAVYEAMAAADDKAIWLMQGWLFHNEAAFWQPPQIKALLTAVPKGRMIILDLFSESYPLYNSTQSYYGQPFIWCMLHNFGGNTGFYGKIEAVNTGPASGLSYQDSTMVGTGITPEGINQNYFIYDLMLEVGYTTRAVNLTDWVTEYVMRRYDSNNSNAIHAWQTLASTVYNDTAPGYPAKRAIRGPIVDRPNTNIPVFPPWYTYKSFLDAWDSFMAALPYLPGIRTVLYDTVDITRQALQILHFNYYHDLAEKFAKKEVAGANGTAAMILFAMDAMDEILATNSHFLMGKWISDARAMGDNDTEKDLYEYNARNQVTLWGPNGEIHDYASKEWASLMSNYYRPRWEMFTQRIVESLEMQTPFSHSKFSHDVFQYVEQPFTVDRTVFPSEPMGDTISTAQKIYKEFRNLMDVPSRLESSGKAEFDIF